MYLEDINDGYNSVVATNPELTEYESKYGDMLTNVHPDSDYEGGIDNYLNV